LNDVEEMAGDFAARFRGGALGRVMGRWHDLGKYSRAFQDYLAQAPAESTPSRGPDHSSAGAQHAVTALPSEWGHLLAYGLAGHHAGLPDWQSPTGQSGLRNRLDKPIEDWSAAPDHVRIADVHELPRLQLDGSNAHKAFQVSVLGRMLFSCLVDADFLCTERFVAPGQTDGRSSFTDIAQMDAVLADYINRLAGHAAPTPLNRLRGEILDHCRRAASLEPGFFSLSVPTGGGKTLAGLAFALRHIRNHADTHGLRRVISAIPYTSIIEQNARVYREAFAGLGDSIVCEHHSNFDPYAVNDRATGEVPWERLAGENWDAPLVVTTNVQFFESLFACSTSKCRKLHNIVGSVIVLDEVQTLPVDLLTPCLAMLSELVTHYQCSVVLCSATQPAIAKRSDFDIGLKGVREIIPDPPRLQAALRRTDIQYVGQRTDVELAGELADRDQALCIVNTKPHARELYERLPRDDTTFHLSTLLCPAHRTRELSQVRQRLKDGLSCRVISTQLIEAGVDIDFPVVWRAMAGLDSIAQAAGRCNREGRLADAVTYVFDPEPGLPRGDIAHAADVTRELLGDFDNLLDLQAIERYFQMHYWKQSHRWDKHDIMHLFHLHREGPRFQYRQIAEKFRMIDQQTRSVIIPWEAAGKRLADQIASLPSDIPAPRSLFRQAQRFTVQVYEYHYQQLLAGGAVTIYHDQFAVLEQPACYDDKLGLCVDRAGIIEPGDAII